MTAVLMVTMAPDRGGAEVVMETIARRLDAPRFHPVLAAPAGGPLTLRWRAEGFTVATLPPVPRLRRLDRIVALRHAVAHAIRDHHIDVVYTHGVAAQAMAGGVARRARVPCVWHAHDVFHAGWSIDALLHRLAAAAPASRVIAISETVAASLRARRAGAIDVVPNGVPAERVAPVAWPEAQPLVVWCGRLQAWKGADVFLRVAQAVRAAHPAARFVIVGDALFGLEPHYPAQLRALASSLGLAEAVTFVGQVEDARPWMAAARVVVHSSVRPEPFGLVVVEAMMQARPVVAFARGGPAEILAGGGGVLVPPDDEAAMARAIVELIASPAHASRLGDAARAHAVERFDAGRMVARVAEVLQAARGQ